MLAAYGFILFLAITFCISVLKLYVYLFISILKAKRKSVYVVIFVVLFTETAKATNLDGMSVHGCIYSLNRTPL